jgi:hypothetical protein
MRQEHGYHEQCGTHERQAYTNWVDLNLFDLTALVGPALAVPKRLYTLFVGIGVPARLRSLGFG